MKNGFVSKGILITKCEMSMFVWHILCLLRIEMLYKSGKKEKQLYRKKEQLYFKSGVGF
jgi:hypothetical protein